MLADSRHRENTFIIGKNFQNREKKCWNSKKVFRSQKKFSEIEKKNYGIEKKIF